MHAADVQDVDGLGVSASIRGIKTRDAVVLAPLVLVDVYVDALEP